MRLFSKKGSAKDETVNTPQKQNYDDDASPSSNDKDQNISNQTVTSSINNFKNKAKQAVKEVVARPNQSRFHDWDDEELREVLVQHNVQVRGAANALHETLVKICDDVFGGEEEEEGEMGNENDEEEAKKEKKKHVMRPSFMYTLEDLGHMDRAARKIQNAFFLRKQRLMEETNYYYLETVHNEEMYYEEGEEFYDGFEDGRQYEDYSQNEDEYSTIHEGEEYVSSRARAVSFKDQNDKMGRRRSAILRKARKTKLLV